MSEGSEQSDEELDCDSDGGSDFEVDMKNQMVECTLGKKQLEIE